MSDRSNVVWKADAVTVVAWIVVGFVGLLLFLPVLSSKTICGPRSKSKAIETQIFYAIKCYETEYGHLPGERANGVYDDPAGNAQLFAILRATDRQQNPRGIVYFEARNARPRKDSLRGGYKLKDGFDEKTGALLDEYCNHYCIRLRPTSGQEITSPYRDLSAKLQDVVIWSLGKDGQQGSKGDPGKFKGSDDVVSWN